MILSQLTIYFTPHDETYPDPLRTDEFQMGFHECDIFLVEMAKQWVLEEPTLESQYNQLSGGEIDEIACNAPRSLEQQLETLQPRRCDFTTELKAAIHRSKKRIVLERIPVPRLEVEQFKDQLVTELHRRGMDAAVAKSRLQQQEMATSMVQRDSAIVELIDQYLKSGAKIFAFRGAAHEAWLCYLLDLRKILFKPLRFTAASSGERLVSELTMGRQVQDIEVLRNLYTMMESKNDYRDVLKQEKDAACMNDSQLRNALAKYLSNKPSTTPRTDTTTESRTYDSVGNLGHIMQLYVP